MKITRRELAHKVPKFIQPSFHRLLVKNPWIPENYDQKLIIIHVPRTGGTNFVNTVFNKMIGHPYLEDYAYNDWKSAKNFLKVAVVRNPWDRFISAYYALSQARNNVYLRKFWDPLGITSIDDLFEAAKCERFFKKMKIVHFKTQSELLECRGMGIDLLGRYENLGEFISNFNLATGRSYELPNLNASIGKRDYRTYYDKERIEIVKNIYWKDIENFGYEF